MEHDFAEILTAKQVAQLLALPQKMVHDLIRSGKIKKYGYGRHVYYLKSQVERLKASL